MNKYFILFFIITFTLSSFAQSKPNKTDLFIGKWKFAKDEVGINGKKKRTPADKKTTTIYEFKKDSTYSFTIIENDSVTFLINGRWKLIDFDKKIVFSSLEQYKYPFVGITDFPPVDIIKITKRELILAECFGKFDWCKFYYKKIP